MRIEREGTAPILAPQFAQPQPLAQPTPTFGQALGAGYRAESPVYAAWAWANARAEADPNWDWETAWDNEPLMTDFGDQLARAQSQEEFDAIRANIMQEQANNQLLASAGWKGFVAAAAGGMISPTTLIPFSGQYRGVKGVAEAFALAGAAATVDESLLFGLQETRTWQDFALGVGAGTVLGGLLGSAAVVVRKGEAEAIVEGMAPTNGVMTISRTTEDGASEELSFPTLQPEAEYSHDIFVSEVLPQTQQARASLPPEAQELIDKFTGPGIMDAAPLEQAYRNGDPITRQIDEAFRPIRDELRTRFGETVRLYRYQRTVDADSAATRGSAIEGQREVMSWTFDPVVARSMADVRNPINTLTQERLDELAEQFEQLGEVDIPELRYRMVNEGDEGVGLYRGDEYITGIMPEDVRPWLKREREQQLAFNKEQEDRYAASVIEKDVAVDDILWVTNDLEQQEAFVRNKPGNSAFIDETGKFQGVPIEPRVRLSTPQEAPALSRSLSAADPRVTPGRLYRGNRVTGGLIDTLAKLNPLTRMLNSGFDAARRIAATLQVPGVRLEGADVFGPAARGGTVYDRANVHQKPIADFVLAYDSAYTKYLYGSKAPRVTPNMLAQIKSGTGMLPKDKISYHEFGERVFDSLNTGADLGDDALNEAVQAGRTAVAYFEKIAKDYHEYRKIYDGEDTAPLFQPLEFEDGEENLAGTLHYMHHMYDSRYIIDHSDQFLNDLQTHYVGLMNSSFQRAWGTYTKARGKMQEYLDALTLSPKRAQDQLVSIEDAIETIESDPIFITGRERLAEFKTNMRSMGMEEADIRLELKALEADLGPEYADLVSARREYSKMRKLFLNVGAGADEQYQKLLGNIEQQQRLQYDQLDQVANAAVRVSKKLGKVTDKVLDKEAQKAVTEMRASVAAFNKQMRTLTKLEAEAGIDESRLTKLTGRVETAERRMARAAERWEKSQTFDRQEVRAEIEEILEHAKQMTMERNAKRASRIEMMKEKAKKLEPEAMEEFRAKERDATVLKIRDLEDKFDELWRAKGAEDLDPSQGRADFTARARENAHLLLNKITGNEGRVVGLDLLAGDRGPELARTLNLPYDKKRQYLIRQPEYVIRSYAHSMAPDLEMYRATGSSNGNVWFRELSDELERKRDRIASDTNLTPEKREKAFAKLDKQYKDTVRDLTVLIDRLRHRRGIPVNPNGFGYRAGRMAQAMNVYRFMGTVAPSSIADLGRPLFYYGLNKTFRNAWQPLITNMPRVKAQKEAAIRAGIGLDPLLHNRAHQIFDIGENYSTNQTLAERGVEFLANKTGLVALFDQWNAFNKHIVSGVVNAELSHAIRVIAEGREGAERVAALDQLTFANLGEEQAARIWDQFMRDGGSTEFDAGVRIPNTESWDDPEAVMMFNQAMNKLANSDIIITPGLDRPSWVDENMAYRLVAQFRSFTFSSTNRIMMAGLQRPDMALLQGSLFSLALGAVSYYTWATARGGNAQEQMQNATAEQWTYEALHRSGLLGVLSEGIKLGEQVPWLNDYAVFGGAGRNTRQASSVMGQAFGPTYDLIERLTNVTLGLSDPTQATLHQARVALVPYQNVFYLSRMFDAIEGAFAETFDIPERRN